MAGMPTGYLSDAANLLNASASTISTTPSRLAVSRTRIIPASSQASTQSPPLAPE